MTEEEKKILSAQEEIQREPVFYYSRERRLSRASPAVRALNDGQTVRPSIRKTLFATKGNILVFLTIVIFTVFGLATRFMGIERPRELSLGRNNLTLSITPVEELRLLEIRKTVPGSGEFYLGEVDIAVSPVITRAQEAEEQEAPQLFAHRIIFNALASETFLIALPFIEDDFFVILRNSDEQKSVRLRVID